MLIECCYDANVSLRMCNVSEIAEIRYGGLQGASVRLRSGEVLRATATYDDIKAALFAGAAFVAGRKEE